MILKELYRRVTGVYPERIEPITGSGSTRRYVRMFGPKTLIGTEGTDLRENQAFLSMAEMFRSEGLNVPEVVAVSDDCMAYLQEDLGDKALFSLIGTPDFDTEARKLMAMLPRFQFGNNPSERAARLRDITFFPTAEMDARSVMWDLNYFKYCLLKPLGIEPDEAELEEDFRTIAYNKVEERPKGLILRDLQSRNVLLRNSTPYIIDFQGARRGPVFYDVASFLWQAKARLNNDRRLSLAEAYVNALPVRLEGDWREALYNMALFRTLQVLGAYGFRGLMQNRPHFVESLGPTIDNLRDLLNRPLRIGRELRRCLEALCGLPQFAAKERPEGRLTVEVNSFGYRKSGIPRDYSGNGGGFVFDCRAMTNPGRFEEYKTLTGRDRAVAEFLESRGEARAFLENATAMVDAAVEKYMARGFSDLKVSFGCTGGQHRSVYCAEHLARHLKERYDVDVNLIHREQPQLNHT